MATLTKANTAKIDRLRRTLDAAINAVYAAGPNRDTKFSECLALASDTTRSAYETARASVDAFEREMIADCRAYRGTFGMFIPY